MVQHSDHGDHLMTELKAYLKRNDCLNHRFSETISCWEVIQELIGDLHLLMFDIFCQGEIKIIKNKTKQHSAGRRLTRCLFLFHTHRHALLNLQADGSGQWRRNCISNLATG